jgi:hypothetical protein
MRGVVCTPQHKEVTVSLDAVFDAATEKSKRSVATNADRYLRQNQVGSFFDFSSVASKIGWAKPLARM